MTLIARLADRARREDAWRDFQELYGNVVFRMARAGGLPRQDAEDVLANVMANFCQSVRSGFKPWPKPAKFRTYLRSITNRQIAEQRRAGQAQIALDPAEAERWTDRAALHEADSAWSRIESEEYLWLCLERLKRLPEIRQRDFEAFLQYAVRGRSAAEVSREFGLTEAGLYRLRHRLLGHLRTIHQKMEQEEKGTDEDSESAGDDDPPK